MQLWLRVGGHKCDGSILKASVPSILVKPPKMKGSRVEIHTQGPLFKQQNLNGKSSVRESIPQHNL